MTTRTTRPRTFAIGSSAAASALALALAGCGGGGDDSDAVQDTAERMFAAIQESVNSGDDLDPIDGVLTGPALEDERGYVEFMWAQGLEIESATTMSWADVEVEDGSDQASASVCADITGLIIRDADGAEVDSGIPFDHFTLLLTLERNDDGEHGWLITDVVNPEETCDPDQG